MKRVLLITLLMLIIATPLSAQTEAEVVVVLDFHNSHTVELLLPPGMPLEGFQQYLAQTLGPLKLVSSSYNFALEAERYVFRLEDSLGWGMVKELGWDFSALAQHARGQGLSSFVLQLKTAPGRNPFHYQISLAGNPPASVHQVDLLESPRVTGQVGITVTDGWLWYMPLILLAAWPFVWAAAVRFRPRLAASRWVFLDYAVLVTTLSLAALLGWVDFAEYYSGGSVSNLGYLALGALGAFVVFIPYHILKLILTHMAAGPRGLKTLPGHLAVTLGNLAALAVVGGGAAAAGQLSGGQIPLFYTVSALLIIMLLGLANRAQAGMLGGTPLAHPCVGEYSARLGVAPPRLLVVEDQHLLFPASAFCNNGNIWFRKSYWLSLSEEEREFIIGHELGHIALDHQRWYVWERAIMLLSLLFVLTMHHWLVLPLWLTLPLGGFVLFMVWASTRRQHRRHEFQCDTIGAWLCDNPRVGVTSLEKAAAAGQHREKILGRLRSLQAAADGRPLKPILQPMPLAYRLSSFVYLLLPLPALGFWPLLQPVHPVAAWAAMGLFFALWHWLHHLLQEKGLDTEVLDFAGTPGLASSLGIPPQPVLLFQPKSGVSRAFANSRNILVSQPLWQSLEGDERRFLITQLLAQNKLNLDRWQFAKTMVYPLAVSLALTAPLTMDAPAWLIPPLLLALFYSANKVIRRRIDKLHMRADSLALDLTGNTLAAISALEKTLGGEGAVASALLASLQTISDRLKERLGKMEK